MTKKIIYFILLAFVSFLIGTQLKGYISNLNTPGDILLLKDIHDFGELKFGQDASVYFKYENIGSKDISINNVSSTCGCTIPEWKKTPIEPNKIDSLLVSYDTNLVGYFSKEITINSGEKSNEDRIWITGTVMNPEDSIQNR